MAAPTRNERGRACELKRAQQAYEKVADRHPTFAAAAIAKARIAALPQSK